MIRPILVLVACLALAPRSHDWPALERELIKRHPYCAACGRSEPEVRLVGHHVVPFSEAQERELDPENVEIYCDNLRRGGDRKAFCHWIVGHAAKSWRVANPYCREQAKAMLRRAGGPAKGGSGN